MALAGHPRAMKSELFSPQAPCPYGAPPRDENGYFHPRAPRAPARPADMKIGRGSSVSGSYFQMSPSHPLATA